MVGLKKIYMNILQNLQRIVKNNGKKKIQKLKMKILINILKIKNKCI